MSATNQTNDVLNFSDEQKPAMPTGINVLTILTIIGSALAFIMGVWQYFRAEKGYRDILKAQENLAEAPAFLRKMMGPEMVEMARKSMEYKLQIGRAHV